MIVVPRRIFPPLGTPVSTWVRAGRPETFSVLPAKETDLLARLSGRPSRYQDISDCPEVTGISTVRAVKATLTALPPLAELTIPPRV